jgi:hypothetical protein
MRNINVEYISSVILVVLNDFDFYGFAVVMERRLGNEGGGGTAMEVSRTIAMTVWSTTGAVAGRHSVS